MGKLFPTRNDLSAKTRTAAVELLNAQLLDLIDLQSQTKFAHWNVKGPQFIALHKLFDEFAESLLESIDETAERATSLGGTATGTVRQAAKGSRVEEFPAVHEGLAVAAALADRYAAACKTTRAASDAADELGDADTADLFTGQSRKLDQYLWFLEAHLVK